MAAHLIEGCDECQVELRSFHAALSMMAIATAAQGAIYRIWQRLESRLSASQSDEQSDIGRVKDRLAYCPTDPSQRPVRTTEVSRGWRLAAVGTSAAAIVLAVISRNSATGIAITRQHDSERLTVIDRQARSLANELEDRNRALATLRDEVSVSGQLTQVVRAPDVRVILLAPLASSPNAAGLRRRHTVTQTGDVAGSRVAHTTIRQRI